MKVFISWSGKLSKGVAGALREWLPMILQSVKPYVSSRDIEKGERWFNNVSKKLEESDFGIICTTSKNQTAPWLNFEAGALGKNLDESRVATLLINLTPSDLDGSLPLASFQATRFSKEEVKQLLQTINNRLSDDARVGQKVIDKLFENLWEEFNAQIESLMKEHPQSHDRDSPRRTTEDLLEELITNTRSIKASLASAEVTMRFGYPTATEFYELSRRALEEHSENIEAFEAPPPISQANEEFLRMLGHICYEPAISQIDLKRYTGLSEEKIARYLGGPFGYYIKGRGDGFYCTRLPNQVARKLALEAGKARKKFEQKNGE